MIKFILLSLCITTTLFSQSLEHKISQMLMVGFPGNELTDSTIINDIQLRKIGGVILMGYNITSPSQVQQLTNSLQSNSQTPLFISVDQEGGRVARLKETNGFAATKTAFEIGTLINNEDSTSVWASLMAGWLQQSGFNVNLAPVADVNVNPNSPAIGLLDRSFSEIPEQVFQHNSWFINELHDKNIFTTLKHFPGHGSANTDSHFGFTDITNTWSDSELIPFHELIQQGYDDFIMSGHLFNANLDSIHPASLSQKVMTNLLRDTLGFNGLVITDGMFMGAITNNYTFDKAVELAINAGNDILLYTSNKIEGRSLVDSIVGIVINKISVGLITEARIEQSYQRIMIKKQNLTNIYLNDDAIIPSGYGLTNYPNPFNATTQIAVTLPVSGNMNLKVYNIIGEEIAEIVNEYFNSGTHRFFFDAKELTSGVYLLVLSAGEKYLSHKIVLMK